MSHEHRSKFRAQAAGLTTLAFFLFSAILFALPLLAAPPGSPYNPGEILNPTCAPTDVNCTVATPAVGTGTSTQIAFFTSSSTVSSNPNFTFATSTGLFTVTATSSFQTVSSTNLSVSGAIGFGSSSTSTSLVFIQGTQVASATLNIMGVTNQTGNLLTISSSTGLPILSVAPNGGLLISTSTLPANALFQIATSSNIFTVLDNGNIGIGTSTPSDSLTINGNIGFANGPKIKDASGKLQFRAGGTGIGATGTGSIYFLDSSGTTRGRVGMTSADLVGTSATGGTITTSGGNTIHTFTSSGTFTIPSGASGTVSYLIVAGGGSGGSAQTTNVRGGGGGAGGLTSSTSFAVTAQAYTVTVGAGGAGVTAGTDGNNGSNSVFGSITATGGGAGGTYGFTAHNGGSGGGGATRDTGSVSGGTGTAGQGNTGGNGITRVDNNTTAAGGGGGSSAVGGNQSGSTGGTGGAGTASSISGSSVTYAGGGGGGGGVTGGAGGAGGGGAGGAGSGAGVTDGTANTGGGGGGASSVGTNTNGGTSGSGGSGIVIISYTTGSLGGGYGTLYIGATNTTASDLAEYYLTHDPSLSPGDVVSINFNFDGSSYGLVKARDPNPPLGIVSTNPGLILGGGDTDKSNERLVALAGKVPTKVSTENGPIKAGDRLGLSPTDPGIAIKAIKPGEAIGIALENFGSLSAVVSSSTPLTTSSSTSEAQTQPAIEHGSIQVFVKVGYWAPSVTLFLASSSDMTLQTTNETGFTLTSLFNFILEQFKRIGVTIKDGVLKVAHIVADSIETKKVVTEELELKEAATGNIYCVKMINGQLASAIGECISNIPTSTLSAASELTSTSTPSTSSTMELGSETSSTPSSSVAESATGSSTTREAAASSTPESSPTP